jgi:hypothetical protein
MFPVFQDPTAVEALISNIVHHINSTYPEKIDAVVGKKNKEKKMVASSFRLNL